VGSERFNAHESTVQGHLVAKRAGTYILQWDNTYSYMKSKALTYQVRTSCDTRVSPLTKCHSPRARADFHQPAQRKRHHGLARTEQQECTPPVLYETTPHFCYLLLLSRN
jgi:hypothetical protein